MGNVAVAMAAFIALSGEQQQNKSDLDPNLVAAIIQVESNFDPHALGNLGEVGLFQLRPEFFGDAVYDVRKNIQIGLRNLRAIKQRCPHQSDSTWIICHNLGVTGAARIKNPKQQTYYKRVMGAYAERKTSQIVGR